MFHTLVNQISLSVAFVHFVSKFNRVYNTHSNPWILFMFIIIQFDLHRFQVVLLGR